jgi:hypothetical protein
MVYILRKYVKEAKRNVKTWTTERGLTLKTKATGVVPSGYHPELDVSDLCDVKEAEYFQQQIGVLRLAVELGRLDITCEVSMLAAFTASPRVGHSRAMLHVFSDLNKHDRSELVLDDSFVRIDDEVYLDWSEFYPKAKEGIPNTIPEPRGNEVQMIVFVDTDHTGDERMRHSRTGVLFYLNHTPIQWFSKKQKSAKTSTFGSGLTAL